MPGAQPLCPQADQRPGLRGGRGWGQLRAAEGEPGRTARQAAGLQPRQAGEVAETREGEGTVHGGQETREDGDTNTAEKDGDMDEGTKGVRL